MDLPRTAINKLRISAAGTERSSAFAAVSRQLSAADLAPSGLPPSSILLVRSVADPLPGVIGTRRPDDERCARWSRRVRDRLGELARRASRPERGRIPTTADAILFADDAELLACLALDLSQPGDGGNWWRRAVARYVSRDSVYSLLRTQLPQVPAAISLLATWRALDDVVAKITPQEAMELAGALVTSFELRALAEVIQRVGVDRAKADDGSATNDGEPVSAGVAPVGRVAATEVASRNISTTTGNAPFARWLTTVSPGLDPSRQLFLGVALAIRRPVFELRTGRFARQVADWLASMSPTERSPPPRPIARHETLSSIDGVTSPDSAQAGEPSPGPVPSQPLLPQPESRSGIDAARELPRPIAETPTAKAADVLPRDEWDGEARTTQLGGLLYLITVMEHLALPGCFEDDCGLASSVGAVGTLEAMARVVAGTRGETLAHDPLWALLAQLDGREPHSPPRTDGLRAPSARLPEKWLAQLGDERPALRESEVLAIEALRRAGWPPALLDWLSLTMPFIGWRIARACGLDDVDEAVRLLIDVPARIYITASHIDVVTSIESIRVPIRLAGLDRSPGWVRSLQRVVLFHFE